MKISRWLPMRRMIIISSLILCGCAPDCCVVQYDGHGKVMNHWDVKSNDVQESWTGVLAVRMSEGDHKGNDSWIYLRDHWAYVTSPSTETKRALLHPGEPREQVTSAELPR